MTCIKEDAAEQDRSIQQAVELARLELRGVDSCRHHHHRRVTMDDKEEDDED